MAWIEYGAFRAALGSASRLPVVAQRWLASALGRIAMLVDRRHTDAARRFVAQALGPSASEREREALVLAAWRHLIEFALEDARYNERVLGPRLLEHYEVEMSDDARRALAAGRGGLGVTAHVGAWEALPPVFAALGGRPLICIARAARNRPMSLFAQRLREARGFQLRNRHGALESVRRVVASGGWAGLLLDQRARGKTVVAPFFGRAAHSERGVAVLARRMRAPIVFAACYRTGKPFRYRAVMPRVMWPEELERLSPEEIAAAINAELERLILAAPQQYFWLHDRYYKAPPVA
jgi:KDO2-lipid IV(A) lauroyltransferase